MSRAFAESLAEVHAMDEMDRERNRAIARGIYKGVLRPAGKAIAWTGRSAGKAAVWTGRTARKGLSDYLDMASAASDYLALDPDADYDPISPEYWGMPDRPVLNSKAMPGKPNFEPVNLNLNPRNRNPSDLGAVGRNAGKGALYGVKVGAVGARNVGEGVGKGLLYGTEVAASRIGNAKMFAVTKIGNAVGRLLKKGENARRYNELREIAEVLSMRAGYRIHPNQIFQGIRNGRRQRQAYGGPVGQGFGMPIGQGFGMHPAQAYGVHPGQIPGMPLGQGYGVPAGHAYGTTPEDVFKRHAEKRAEVEEIRNQRADVKRARDMDELRRNDVRHQRLSAKLITLHGKARVPNADPADVAAHNKLVDQINTRRVNLHADDILIPHL